MPKLLIRTRQGEVVCVDAESGLSVMETLRSAGIDEITAVCGGACSCATCHVYVDQAFASLLPPMSENEHELLGTSEHRSAASRLSCQLLMAESLNGLSLTIAPED